uniref:Protein kinase domain-containing protein n=1 Tax=Craspedostauros australis TaxID=1486917 RepID=A0A6T6I6H9_9STRA|mmetsp:Transcript_9941/g.27187  ORF Transcript_9941/g.27187 Transcript_9941/m.27187 type:complete len:169 (+) Transcript_9941:249-755(+)
MITAKFVADKTYTLCGTPNYLAPEMVMNQGHGVAVDHWALGVVIYEMVAGENPFYFDGMDQMELFRSIVQEQYYALPDGISEECEDVIAGLLVKEQTQRLGSLANRGKDIIRMPWFKKLDLYKLRQKKVDSPFQPKNAMLESLLEESMAEQFGGMSVTEALAESDLMS